MPSLSLAYDSAGGDGVLGIGFSLGGLSAITRCPSNLADDGAIRGVRHDTADKLCLDGKRLVPVGQEAGNIVYRTLPDIEECTGFRTSVVGMSLVVARRDLLVVGNFSSQGYGGAHPMNNGRGTTAINLTDGHSIGLELGEPP